MELIQNNPYRILGVKANASLSDRNQQANLIAQYLKIGKSAKLDFDISPPLSSLTRTKELIDLQPSKIFSTEDKILFSLFWFVEANAIDKIALKHLTGSKDTDKALADFEKGCRGFVVSPESYSAILNYSTLQIISYNQHKDIGKLKTAIAHKFNIVSDPTSLAILKELVAPENINTSVEKILELAIPKLKELLMELIPSVLLDKLMLDIFETNTVIYPKLKIQVIDALVKQVDSLVAKTDTERDKCLEGYFDTSMIRTAVELGKKLIWTAKQPLKEIEELLGKSDPVYTDALNKVYTEVNYCGVLPFNKFFTRITENNDLGLSNNALLNVCDFTGVVSLYAGALSEIGILEIPIRHNITQNKSVIQQANSKIQSQKNQSGNGGSCFIATAALGSYDHSQVMELRLFRDEWILTKNWGAGFVKWYYHYGAIVAKFIEKSFTLKKLSYLFIVKPLVILSRIVKNK